MLNSLLLTAFLMGLGGMVHCASMCGAACAVAFPSGVSWKALSGRALGYAALGAIAAAAAGWVSQWSREVAMLKPVWMMLQLAAVLLGLMLLLQGRVPARLDEMGRALYQRLQRGWFARQGRLPAWSRPALPVLGGLAWALLPCGLLYSALVVAALAPTPASGALVMLAFALPSAVGVWSAPFLLNWIRRLGRPVPAQAATPVPVIWMQRGATAPPGSPAREAGLQRLPGGGLGESGFSPTWAVRLSGLCLAGIAATGLWHQLWAQYQAWCA